MQKSLCDGGSVELVFRRKGIYLYIIYPIVSGYEKFWLRGPRLHADSQEGE